MFEACQCDSSTTRGQPVRNTGGVSSATGSKMMIAGAGGASDASESYRYGSTTACEVHDQMVILDGDSDDPIHPGWEEADGADVLIALSAEDENHASIGGQINEEWYTLFASATPRQH
jgi:hypothetical protein